MEASRCARPIASPQCEIRCRRILTRIWCRRPSSVAEVRQGPSSPLYICIRNPLLTFAPPRPQPHLPDGPDALPEAGADMQPMRSARLHAPPGRQHGGRLSSAAASTGGSGLPRGKFGETASADPDGRGRSAKAGDSGLGRPQPRVRARTAKYRGVSSSSITCFLAAAV